ncbi:MAG: response regulator [Longimicrobiales bacterium]
MKRPVLILLYEPDPDTREIWSTYLASRGFRVRAVADPEEALRLAKAEAPAALITEYPAAWDGASLVARLKRDPATRNICVIVATSRVMSGEEATATQEGADYFLPKPVDPRHVIRTLEAVLRGHEELPA